MEVLINGVKFIETDELYPIKDGVYYQNKWYKPIDYKINEWIIYLLNGSEIVRKIISEKEYNEATPEVLRDRYLEWMTVEAANTVWQKNIVRKATEKEIYEHLQKMAKEKGLVKNAKVKRLSALGNVTIVQEDDDYYIEEDEYCKSGIVLYKNGQWVEKIQEPEFTFGGQKVTFKVVNSGGIYNFKTVEINCNGETGTHHELATILTHYFRPMKFGNVCVKRWTRKNQMCVDIYKGFDVNDVSEDLKIVDTVTIGCLTGTYAELVKIFNHCQTLLK